MPKQSPGFFDRVRIWAWSREDRLQALRQQALAGNVGWVGYLLAQTGYESYPDLLSKAWWSQEADPANLGDRLATARTVVRWLFDHIRNEDLPRAILAQLPQTEAARNQLILRLAPTDKYVL